MNKKSFFYNKFSKERLDASCESYNFLEWGINNYGVFNFDSIEEISNFTPQMDDKIFKHIIYEQGWSYVNVENDYCYIAAKNFESAKELLNIILQENTFKSACISIEDLNALFVEESDIEFYLNNGNFENHIFDNLIEKNIQLNELIKELKLLDCADRIFVFGSTTKGKISPPDLDIWIDCVEKQISSEEQNKLLELVEKYDVRLDPYIRTKENLFALDSNVFTWTFKWIDLMNIKENNIIKDVNKFEAAAKKGILINDLELLPVKVEDFLKHINIDKILKMKI